jgi:hypothetical protein
MTMGRFRNIHLVLMLGIAFLTPLLLAYSLYADLSETVFLSSDMSFEGPGDEDLSVCQNEFKVFVPAVSSIILLPGDHLRGENRLFLSSLTSLFQNKPVLRC